jgi:hypothetical protein
MPTYHNHCLIKTFPGKTLLREKHLAKEKEYKVVPPRNTIHRECVLHCLIKTSIGKPSGKNLIAGKRVQGARTLTKMSP